MKQCEADALVSLAKKSLLGVCVWSFQQIVTMKGIHSLAGLLLVVVVQSSWQVPLQEAEDNSRYSSIIADLFLLTYCTNVMHNAIT